MKPYQLISAHISEVLKLAEGKIHGPGGAAELLGMIPNTLRWRLDKLRHHLSTPGSGKEPNLGPAPLLGNPASSKKMFHCSIPPETPDLAEKPARLARRAFRV
jgi:hypothetical protein